VINSPSTGSGQGEIQNGTPTIFRDTTAPFADVEDGKDLLSVLADATHTNPQYLGNWSIDTKVNNKRLELSETYTGTNTSDLNYVVGNTDRYIDGHGVFVADIKSTTGYYVTDESGTGDFVVTYDRILAGHTVTISANAFDTERIGASIVAGLRWDDYQSSIVKIPNDGSDHNVTLSLSVSGVEPLVGLDIVPSSIQSNDGACGLNATSTDNNLTTDINGQITVVISTGLSSSTATECDISWSATQGGIYKEY
jgi:hypothetical protein